MTRTVYLEDSEGRDIDYPLDWAEIADLELEPCLVIKLNPAETREILAAAESDVRSKYSSGGSAQATLVVSYSNFLIRRYENGVITPFYLQNMDACVIAIKPGTYHYSEECYETAPDEWVAFDYRKSSYGNDYWYWLRESHFPKGASRI